MDEGRPLYMLPAFLALASAVIYGLAVIAEYFTQGYSEWWPYIVYSAIYFVAYMVFVFPPDIIKVPDWVALIFSAVGIAISIPAIYPCLVFFGGIGGAISLLVALYYFIKIRYTLSKPKFGSLISLLRVVPAVSMYPVVAYYTVMTLYELFTFGRPPELRELKYYWLLVYVVAYSIIVTMFTTLPGELGGRKGLAIALNTMATMATLVMLSALQYPQRLALLTHLPIAVVFIALSVKFRTRVIQQYRRREVDVREIKGELV